MKAEDFAAWLSAISGMNEGQRTEAIAALEKAIAVGTEGGASAKKAGQRSRQKDALGTTSHRARRGSGLSSLRGTRGRRLGPLARTFAVSLQELWAHLQCADQDPDGASAQEGEWLDHARAMIEGKSLAKTAQACGVHPTTAFRWRHRFLRAPAVNKPRSLSGIVEADETFVLDPSRAAGPICRAGHANEAARPGIRGPIRTIFPFSSPATGRARPSTRSCLRSTGLP